jgi:hypothetical protein
MRVHAKIGRVLVAAAVSAASLTMMTAAAHAATVNGCPAGNDCLYNSQGAYNAGSPSLTLKVSATYLGNPILIVDTDLAADTNNTDPAYSSEGNFVLEVPGVLCAYVPDSTDEQAPGQTEDPAGGTTVDAVQFGSTAAQADATTVALLSACG